MTELVRKDASSSNGGELTAGSQTIAGAKTWSGAQTFQQPISGFVAGNDTRNLIINGNFDFWQRGTSVIASNSGYLADRFEVRALGGATSTADISRSTNVPTATESGFSSSYSLLIDVNGTATPTGTQTHVVRYFVEGNDYAAIHSRTVRLQFWVKSTLTGLYSVSFNNSAADRSYVVSYTINAANTWEKKTIDLTMDNSGTWLFDNGIGLQINWVLNGGPTWVAPSLNTWLSGTYRTASGQANLFASGTNTFQLAQVQLIPGSFQSTVTIPFSRAGRTMGDELRMCQRYYEKSYFVDTIPGTVSDGVVLHGQNGALSANRTYLEVFMRVNKRASPSVAFYSPTTGSSGTVNYSGSGTYSSVALNYIKDGSFVCDITTTGATAGTVATGHLHYTASAEF